MLSLLFLNAQKGLGEQFNMRNFACDVQIRIGFLYNSKKKGEIRVLKKQRPVRVIFWIFMFCVCKFYISNI